MSAYYAECTVSGTLALEVLTVQKLICMNSVQHALPCASIRVESTTHQGANAIAP